jgi:5'-deoxynucleotidase YfbR-like HD superfamily hydrolase
VTNPPLAYPHNEDRIGDWICTRTGIRFYPFDPREDEISIVDIAHHLSMICRFGGACAELFTVAQHSVMGSLAIEPAFAMEFLLHDAAEAYICDIPRPIKRHPDFARVYDPVESKIDRLIRRKFNLPETMSPDVKRMDNVMLATEKRDLMNATSQQWHAGDGFKLPDPLLARIIPWEPRYARRQFLARFCELTEQDLTPIMRELVIR